MEVNFSPSDAVAFFTWSWGHLGLEGASVWRITHCLCVWLKLRMGMWHIYFILSALEQKQEWVISPQMCLILCESRTVKWMFPPAWRESIPDEMRRERVKRSCLQTLTTSKCYSDILSDGNWRNNTFFQHKCSYNRNKNGLLFNTLYFWKRFCSVNRYHINTFILTN